MIDLDTQELATIRAALLYYLQNGQGDPAGRDEETHAVAQNLIEGQDEEVVSMDDDGITSLLRRKLNLRLCQCDNCDHVCTPEALNEAAHLGERLDFPIGHPDCIEPSGECPVCGALSYDMDQPRRDGSTR